ncbi:hypothetical protein COO91_09562 (plasmid) [Nostoc flagelliforme CCNUN1]|uniref:Uncharacterized protein n=1 Tax=Nostoc flagelliforme CCNUN1 TaxID=2038116 RepID=A0A2K8T6R2_9NOSO|nr:hypothetical protein [Nostoc flagelliforme]AUB43387.1 hypothetical protein COO91_09562 [Nostoc flagelliforme CCNUN1]
MDIQSTLTQAIEFIVMSFVALMIFDLIDGLYVVPLPPIAIAQSNTSFKSTVTATQAPLSNTKQLKVEPQQIPFVTSHFEKISDPWTLELEPHNSSTKTQPVVLQFPSQRLLPRATEVQPKSLAKTAKKSTPLKGKTTKTTDTTAKATSTKAPRKPARPRKHSA